MNITVPIPYDEFRVWKQLIAPKVTGLNDVAEEILNNAQDHSEGKKCQHFYISRSRLYKGYDRR
jgi:hypothetical protein